MLRGIRALFGRKGKAALGALVVIILVSTLNVDEATAQRISEATLILATMFIGGTALEDHGKHRANGNGSGNGGAPAEGGTDVEA